MTFSMQKENDSPRPLPSVLRQLRAGGGTGWQAQLGVWLLGVLIQMQRKLSNNPREKLVQILMQENTETGPLEMSGQQRLLEY